jgi:hypothetical protein
MEAGTARSRRASGDGGAHHAEHHLVGGGEAEVAADEGVVLLEDGQARADSGIRGLLAFG